MNMDYANDDDRTVETALEAALGEIARLESALQPFVTAYHRHYDPALSYLGDEQAMTWHIPLGAYRSAITLLGRRP